MKKAATATRKAAKGAAKKATGAVKKVSSTARKATGTARKVGAILEKAGEALTAGAEIVESVARGRGGRKAPAEAAANRAAPCFEGRSDVVADCRRRNRVSACAYAVTMFAASSRPSSRIDSSRILYFWTLPLTVIGQPSTKRT